MKKRYCPLNEIIAKITFFAAHPCMGVHTKDAHFFAIFQCAHLHPLDTSNYFGEL